MIKVWIFSYLAIGVGMYLMALAYTWSKFRGHTTISYIRGVIGILIWPAIIYAIWNENRDKQCSKCEAEECLACKWSGVDDQEWINNGCPDCICGGTQRGT